MNEPRLITFKLEASAVTALDDLRAKYGLPDSAAVFQKALQLLSAVSAPGSRVYIEGKPGELRELVIDGGI